MLASGPFEALVGQLELLDQDLVTARVETGSAVLARPRADELESHDHGLRPVQHVDLAVLAVCVDLAFEYGLAPRPQLSFLVDAALERDVAPADLSRELLWQRQALRRGGRVVDHMRLGREARDLCEVAGGLRAAERELVDEVPDGLLHRGFCHVRPPLLSGWLIRSPAAAG